MSGLQGLAAGSLLLQVSMRARTMSSLGWAGLGLQQLLACMWAGFGRVPGLARPLHLLAHTRIRINVDWPGFGAASTGKCWDRCDASHDKLNCLTPWKVYLRLGVGLVGKLWALLFWIAAPARVHEILG